MIIRLHKKISVTIPLEEKIFRPFIHYLLHADVSVGLLGGGKLFLPVVQDDLGCGSGIAIDEKRLRQRLDLKKDIWCEAQVLCSRGHISALMAVCRVKIPALDLDVYTTIAGLPNLDDGEDVLVFAGRFMIGDAQSKLFSGPLSGPLQLPLDDKVLTNSLPCGNIFFHFSLLNNLLYQRITSPSAHR